jgi:predicted ester cyclase
VRQTLRRYLSKPNRADLEVLKGLIECGTPRPVIERTFPLQETPAALRQDDLPPIVRAMSTHKQQNGFHVRTSLVAAVFAAVALLAGCGSSEPAAPAHQETPTEDQTVKKHLEIFDDLDFNAYSNQDWAAFHRSHADNILVHYPDGHTTKGFDAHIEELKPMFVFAPDTSIKVHPVKFGSGDWTSVIGVMEGTFSKPMPIGDGKTISPTGKRFKLSMSTVGHWKNGLMDEEYLFWDNQDFMKQIGLAK